MVGAARFELATPCSRSKCATRLRYAPPDRKPEFRLSSRKREIEAHQGEGRYSYLSMPPQAPDLGATEKPKNKRLKCLLEAKRGLPQPGLRALPRAIARPTATDYGAAPPVLRHRLSNGIGM